MKKKNTFYAFMTIASLSLSVNAQTQAPPIEDNIEVGPGYANEVYYKLSDGTKTVLPANDWHLGFSTGLHSANIFTNVGLPGGMGQPGLEVAVWPNGTNDAFGTVTITDTTGFANWEKLYNDSLSYEIGAFNQNAAGDLDYGWGAYDMGTHIITGDSVYILKIGQDFYKLDIVKKELGTVTLRYAKLDATASDGTTVEIPVTTYSTKKFVFFNIVDGQIKDREVADWDLWALKYHDKYASAESPQGVNGIIVNPKYKVAAVHVGPPIVDADGNVTADKQALDNSHERSATVYANKKNAPGQHYKDVNYQTGQWFINDSTVWYLKDATTGDIWKWYPTKFESGTGTGPGRTTFMKQKMTISIPCNINVTEKELCIDSTLTLVGNVGGQGWWSIVEGSDFATIENGTLKGVQGGDVILGYDESGCTKTAENTITIKNCAKNGIEDLTTSFVDLYPNPANNNVTIVFDSKATTANISLKNQIGQVVFTENANTNSGIYSQTIDLSTLTSGMYFVEIVQNGVSTVKTIVKN